MDNRDSYLNLQEQIVKLLLPLYHRDTWNGAYVEIAMQLQILSTPLKISAIKEILTKISNEHKYDITKVSQPREPLPFEGDNEVLKKTLMLNGYASNDKEFFNEQPSIIFGKIEQVIEENKYDIKTGKRISIVEAS